MLELPRNGWGLKEKRKIQRERKKTLPDEEIGKYLAKMPKQEGMN